MNQLLENSVLEAAFPESPEKNPGALHHTSMPKSSPLDFLFQRIEHYITLTNEDRELILQLFKEEHVAKNQVLLKEGEVCRKVFFIARGVLRFSKMVEGEDRTFVFRPEGAFVSDIESFRRKTPSSNTITTVGSCILFTITHDDMEYFYRNISQGERFGRLVIEEVFIMAVTHLTTFYSDSPEQRYLRFVKQHKNLLQRIPQYHIASYLGVTPQALCRIKKKLLQSDL